MSKAWLLCISWQTKDCVAYCRFLHSGYVNVVVVKLNLVVDWQGDAQSVVIKSLVFEIIIF